MNVLPFPSERSLPRGVSARVTVVIPCYNAARTLKQSIQSALDQSHSEIEVVVVDDGSTDDPASVCASFNGLVRLVRQPNRGLSAARNAGVEAATGEYVTLLDADDLLLPNCIARRVEILEADPEIGLVAGWFREIDAEGRTLDRVPERREVWREAPFRQAVRRNWGPPVGWTFRRDAFFRVGGFDPLLSSCEDWDFVIRVASRYGVGYDAEPSVRYRKSAGQMSSHHHTMLDAAERVHRKNRAWAVSGLKYWIDVRFGRFELGRRTLYAVLFGPKEGRSRLLADLVRRHPYLLWVFVLSALSYAFGKRASSGRLQ